MRDSLKLRVAVIEQENNVFENKAFIRFTPNELLIRAIQPDLLRKKMLIYYELRNSDLTTEGYISRNQVESGSVEIDIDTLLMAVEDGNLENPVMNKYITNLVLQNFQLQLTSVSPIL